MMSEEKTYSVGISGSCGGLNLGDEAILHSIITQSDAPCPWRLQSSSETETQGIKLGTFHE